MNRTFLRKLVKKFGWLVNTLPPDYKPAAQAFLFSLTNEIPDCERPVPQEILPTIAFAVVDAVLEDCDISYEEAILILDHIDEPIQVTQYNYPHYNLSSTIREYRLHPHYYVMGSFTAYPQGDGFWLVEDRYDWHFEAYWRVPDEVVTMVPQWILCKLCEWRDGAWRLSEVGTLDKWTVPYWHRSVVKLSDYLDPTYFDT
jgi:hypothetical protein